MEGIRNQYSISVLKNTSNVSNKLQSSFRKISSGDRINEAGDDPTGFGISAQLRNQIRNSVFARRNVENTLNVIGTTDSWLGETQNIINRMGELAVGAIDGTKTAQDREILNTEFLQLKAEVKRIAKDAHYNSRNIAGQDQILVYDKDKKTFQFSQLDGTEKFNLPVKVLSGAQAANSADFKFSGSTSYTLSHDGKYIFYVDNSNYLVKYNIESNELARYSATATTKNLEVDEMGRLWYADRSAAGAGYWHMKQMDIENWTQDTAILGNNTIPNMLTTEFQVYGNKAYFLNSAGNIVSQSLINTSEVSIELDIGTYSISSTVGQFAISEDGQYVASVPSAGVVRIFNMATKSEDRYEIGSAAAITDLHISVDNSRIVFRDTTTKRIWGIDVTDGDEPKLGPATVLFNATSTNGFKGLSVDGASPISEYEVHIGAKGTEDTRISLGDVRLYTLGLSRVDISSVEGAQEAIGLLSDAANIINAQRARVGSQYSRLQYTHEALSSYHDHLTQADSIIRDTDLAAEVSNMTGMKILYEADISLLSQVHTISRAALNLLQR